MTLLTDGQIESMRATVTETFDAVATVLRSQAGTDRYGNTAVDSWVEVAWFVQCSIARKNETEIVDGRDTQITDWTIRMPVDTQISGRDRIRVGTTVYEAVGEPQTFPTHVHVDVRHVDG